MQPTSIIGPSIVVTGDISADEPLTIAGRVDGTVRVNGHVLTIDGAGHANATVQAESPTAPKCTDGSRSRAPRAPPDSGSRVSEFPSVFPRTSSWRSSGLRVM